MSDPTPDENEAPKGPTFQGKPAFPVKPDLQKYLNQAYFRAMEIAAFCQVLKEKGIKLRFKAEDEDGHTVWITKFEIIVGEESLNDVVQPKPEDFT